MPQEEKNNMETRSEEIPAIESDKTAESMEAELERQEAEFEAKDAQIAATPEDIRQKLESQGSAGPEVTGEKDEDPVLEAKKERVAENLIKKAVAVRDDPEKLRKVMEKAEKLSGKYPDLADKVHDRIIERLNELSGGMYS